MLSDEDGFTHRTTNINQEDRNNIFSEDAIIMAFIAILASLLKVKFHKEGRKTIFETDFSTMVALLVVSQVYCVALLAKMKLIETFENYVEIIKLYIHLCGILSTVLLQMMLVPVVGQILLVIWACCFILLTYWLFAKINARPADARNGDNLDTESNMPANEEPNGDGFDKTPNE